MTYHTHHPLRSIKTARTASVPQRVLSQEKLHRVDATQIPHGAGVSLGHCRTDNPAPTGCSGTWGSCISHPDCPDTNCEGHPHNQPSPDDVDHTLRAAFWLSYIVAVVCAIGAVAVVVLA